MHSYTNNNMRHYSNPASIAVSLDDSYRGLERIGPPKLSSKSRSIAIKRTRPGGKPHENEDTVDSSKYDMATWRMYHRIVNHRTSQKDSVDSSEDTSDSSDSSLPLRYAGIAHGNHLPPARICIQELDQIISEMEEDEGIFQLDL
jgi:hypothetical protein